MSSTKRGSVSTSSGPTYLVVDEPVIIPRMQSSETPERLTPDGVGSQLPRMFVGVVQSQVPRVPTPDRPARPTTVPLRVEAVTALGHAVSGAVLHGFPFLFPSQNRRRHQCANSPAVERSATAVVTLLLFVSAHPGCGLDVEPSRHRDNTRCRRLGSLPAWGPSRVGWRAKASAIRHNGCRGSCMT